MKVTGANVVPFPVAQVWDALLDPRVLVRTIPGCERLEATGPNSYAMTVTAGVAAIKGTYAGSCDLSDLAEHSSLVMRLSGAGAPGTIDASVDVAFSDLDDGTTRVSYEADAVVGGMVGGVGQRMLTSVSKRMAKEFFDNVAGELAGGMAGETAAEAVGVGAGREADVGASAPSGMTASPGQVFTAPARASGVTSQQDFLKGVVVGAGLVLAGVVVGGITSRRALGAVLSAGLGRRR